MYNTSQSNRLRVLLVLILVSAAGLRIWGVWFGLPFTYGVDENHEVFRALELGTGSFNFDRTAKGGYFYILFVEYGLLFAALMAAGVIDSAQEFARYFARDPSSFYLIGRATTAVIGTLNVFFVYRLGSRGYSTGAGLLAAVFLSVDFLHARESHFITVDVLMTCFTTVALLFAVRMATGGRRADYRWAALFAALATTTKIPAILLLAPLLVAHYYYVRRQGGSVYQMLGRDVWWAAAIFIGVLAITNPGLFLNPPMPGMFIDGEGTEAEIVEQIVNTPNLWAFYIGALRDSMGWPLFLVSISGVAYALWKRTPTDAILVTFGMVYYVAFASPTETNLYYPRYMLPVIGVLTVLAGRLIATAWPNKKGVATVAAGIAVGAFMLLPTYHTVLNNYQMSQKDTRTIAKEWIESNIPAGASILIEGIKIEPTRLTVPLQDTADNLREYIEYYKEREPGKAKYLQYRLQVLSGATFDLILVNPRELQSLNYYKRAGVEYLIVRPEAFTGSRTFGLTGKGFVEALAADGDVSLLKTFQPDAISRPGPLIEVYRIDVNTCKRSHYSSPDSNAGVASPNTLLRNGWLRNAP